MRLVGLCLCVVLMSGCHAPIDEAPRDLPKELPQQIADRMAAQEASWSAGDISRFMALAYMPSDSLLFVGSRGLTQGYEVVLENYKTSYPSGAEMGQLSFENLLWQPLAPEVGLLIGKWHLARADEPLNSEASLQDLSGHYSLVWKWFGKERGWLIVADHSS